MIAINTKDAVDIPLPKLDAWLQRRSSLHHDWFSNRILTFVEAHQSGLDALFQSPDSPHIIFFLKNLEIWSQRSLELREWNAAALVAFHPGQYLETNLFANMDEHDRLWLMGVLDDWYGQQSEIPERIALIDALWLKIDQVINQLLNRNGKPGDGVQLYEWVFSMSREISAYPAKVLIP